MRHDGGGAAVPVAELVGEDSKVKEKKPTAKTPNKLPKKRGESTAKVPQKPEVEKSTAKTKDEDFAVGFFDEDDEDFAVDDFFAVDGVDSDEWRIEKRYYEKQDGSTMLYYNYRKRKGKKDKKTGKRINEYKSGGKRAIS